MDAAKLDWLLQQATGEACGALELTSSTEQQLRLPDSPQTDDTPHQESAVALEFNVTEYLKELFDAALPADESCSQLVKVSTLLVGLNSEIQSSGGSPRSTEDMRALRRVQRGLASMNHGRISCALYPGLPKRFSNPRPRQETEMSVCCAGILGWFSFSRQRMTQSGREFTVGPCRLLPPHRFLRRGMWTWPRSQSCMAFDSAKRLRFECRC